MEKILHCPSRPLRDVHLAFFQPLVQLFKGYVDHLDLVGPVKDRVGHGFLNADAGDLGDHVKLALEMLNVDRRIDIDPVL